MSAAICCHSNKKKCFLKNQKMKHCNLMSWYYCSRRKDALFFIQSDCKCGVNLISPYEKPVESAKSQQGVQAADIQGPVKNTKRVKVTIRGHLFSSFCGWAVPFFSGNFLISTKPMIFSHRLSALILSSQLLWSNCYLNVSTRPLFWRKKMMYYIYNKLLYIE